MGSHQPLPSAGVDIIIVATIFLFLAILAVVARFYSRYIQRKAICTDDWLILAGLVVTIATMGIGYSLVLDGGAGLHMEDASPEQIAIALKLFVPAPLLWGIATSLVKLSILFFYITVFTMRPLRKGVYAVIGLTIAMMIAIILESFLLCRPFAFTWDKTIPGGVCGSTTKAYLSVAIVNLFIDIAIVLLPMPVLWGLKMATKRKVAISAILCLGLLVCALTAARIKSVLDLDPNDFTYTVVHDLIFGALEIELGIITACMPLMAPLLRKAFGSESALASIWTKKNKTSASANNSNWNNKKNTASSRSFHRLPEDMHPLDEVSEVSASSKTHWDLESQGAPLSPCDVMVTRDIYIHSDPATHRA